MGYINFKHGGKNQESSPVGRGLVNYILPIRLGP